MKNKIHQTAVIHPGAEIGHDVEIGPYCVIGPHVVLGDGSVLKAHVIIDGHTEIGKNNRFHPFCSIGGPPQDLSYKNEPTRVKIGDHNTFREYISINRGTLKQDQMTLIGSHCLLMSYVHLGHDVEIGDRVIMANACNIAGHVKIGDRVYLGGGTNISQFVEIGQGAYIGGGSGVDRDIPHFCTAYGNRVRLKGINIIGLKRQGYEKVQISELVDFYRMMEASTLSARSFAGDKSSWQDYQGNELVQELSQFVFESKSGIAPFMS